MTTPVKTVSTPALRGLRIIRNTALCAFAVLTAHAHAGLYTAVKLDTLNNGYNIEGINASGQVAGSGYYRTGGGEEHATRWNGTVATDLGTLGGTFSRADGINASGQVVGWANLAGDSVYHATLWNGTTATDLGTLSGTFSRAYGINASGQIVGYADDTTGYNMRRATLWNGTTATALATLGSGYSVAYAINDSGQVVGETRITGSVPEHATLWNGTTVTDLGTLGGSVSNAYGINASGQVVGYSDTTGSAASHATLWNGTTATDLGTLGGISSRAYGINASGQVVGYSYLADGSFDPFLYTGGQMFDLYSLLENGSGFPNNLTVTGINDLGQISAWGYFGGQSGVFRLDPTAVPEPGSIGVLFTFALGAVALLGRAPRLRRI